MFEVIVDKVGDWKDDGDDQDADRDVLEVGLQILTEVFLALVEHHDRQQDIKAEIEQGILLLNGRFYGI